MTDRDDSTEVVPYGSTTPRHVWQFVGRQKILIVCTILVGVAAAAAYNLLATPIYEGWSTIRVDDKHSIPTALSEFTGLAPESEVATEMEVLDSRSHAEHVVDSLGLQVELVSSSRVPGHLPPRSVLASVKVSRDARNRAYRLTQGHDGVFTLTNRTTGEHLGDVVPGKKVAFGGVELTLSEDALEHKTIDLHVLTFRQALSAVQQTIHVTRPKVMANIIEVSYTGSDPYLAREVPNVLVDHFIRRRQRSLKSGAKSTAHFLRTQLANVSTQLTDAEDRLQAFREREQAISLPEQANAQVTGLVQAVAQRNALDAERSALDKLLRDVRSKDANRDAEDPSPYREVLAFPSILRNPAAAQLLGALTAVEDERAALLNRRTPQDPDVQALTKRAEDLQRQGIAMSSAYLNGLTNQVEAIDKTLGQSGQQLRRIPAKEVAFARLQRRTRVLEDLSNTLQTRLKEAEIAQGIDDPSVRVIDAAVMPSNPSSPRENLNLAGGALLGLLLGTTLALVRDGMNRTIRTRHDLRQAVDLPVLGLIPHADMRLAPRGARALRAAAVRQLTGRPSGSSLTEVTRRLKSPAGEAYRSLRTSIMFALENDATALVFTSPMPEDGKTTSALNMAIVFAQQRFRVLLIDADMRRGRLHAALGTERAPGLSNVLTDEYRAEDVPVRIEAGATGSAFDFVPTGTLPSQPVELLGSPNLPALIDRYRSQYDVIVIDAPPLNLVADAALLGACANASLIVVRAGATTVEALDYTLEQLRSVRAPVLGCILNDVDPKLQGHYYGGYPSYEAYSTPTHAKETA